jgi:hypothetical protein
VFDNFGRGVLDTDTTRPETFQAEPVIVWSFLLLIQDIRQETGTH